ncbi:MAG: gamma-glutamylcyclotransferase [Acidobacteriota bacterium]|nr:gamma-glutamylcyclotransferase [Acidobacteriota bacterium]
MPHKLFVYGTLHPDTAPEEVREEVRRFQLVGKGTVKGKLLDLGSYPGVLLKSRGTEEVPGHIFAIPQEPELLDRLDRYEEYSADFPDSSLFLRKLVKVKREDGSTERCWVYALNPIRLERFASAS